MARSQSYGLPLWPRVIATSQATISATSSGQPGDRGRLQVDLREALVAAVAAQPADRLAAPREQEEQAERGQAERARYSLARLPAQPGHREDDQAEDE